MAENFINPLALIGRSNVTPTDNSAVQKLLAADALQKLKNSGQLDTTALGNEGTLNAQAQAQGLDRSSPSFPANLEQNRQVKNFGTTSEGAAAAQRGGFRFKLPTAGAIVGELPGLQVEQGDFPGTAAERVKAVAEVEKSDRRVDKTLRLPGDVQVGLTQSQRETGSKTKNSQANTPRARRESNSALDEQLAKRIMLFIQTKKPGSKVEGPFRFPDGSVHVTIDGVDTIVGQ